MVYSAPNGSWHATDSKRQCRARERFDVIDKQVKTTADAVAGVRDGSTVLVAGFGAVGVADHLLDALHEQGARELTIVANNSGNGDYGLARLINSGRVRKVICSYPRSGDYSAFLKAYRARSLELELVPQGTISERMLPCGRPWRVFLAGFGGDQARRGQGNPGNRWPAARVREAAEGGCCVAQGQQGRPLGQSHLHKVGAEFQPRDGNGRRSDRRGSRQNRGAWRDGS